MNDFILYNTEDGKAEIKIILDNETKTIWLNQKQMAELFDIKSNTVTEHIKHVFEEGELEEASTTRSYRVVQREGERDIERDVTHYNLKVILAVGYRVRSKRGTQFRKWATETLNEYLVKGFAMNDERLKDPKGWDYFDELLERVREIRASEKRFYQKVRDLFKATSVDYDKSSDQAKVFFQTIQNKLLFAETGKTAAELIIDRADANLLNMGLTSFKGTEVRKGDISTAKNYLKKDEIEGLNRLVTMFLDFAEDRAKRRQQISMSDWVNQVDSFLQFNEREILQGAGKKSHEEMVKHVENEYSQFHENNKIELNDDGLDDLNNKISRMNSNNK